MLDFSRLRICFLAGTLEHGGAERQLFYMLQALCRGGASPRLFCFHEGEFWEEAIRSLGVSVTWVGQRQSRLARLLRVLRELRRDPPDVIQSQHFFANAYVAVSASLLRLRGIGAIRNEAELELRENGPIGGWLNLHLPGILAANSALAIQQAVARGIPRSRLYFLPNVVDTERFQPAGGPATRPLSLLAVGRVVVNKRFDRFISVLGRLRRETGLNIRGIIAGPPQDDALRRQLQSQAVRLGLYPQHLRFVGSVSDMNALYRRADVCVLTSDFEGTPNVLLEAMASGLPVVATNAGGVEAIVRNAKTGFVLDRNDAEGLFAALRQLVTNESMRREMGGRARQHVEEQHSLQRLPALLSKLYELALAKARQWRPETMQRSPV